MHELEALWIFLVEVDAGNTAIIDLTPEFMEIGAALVPYPCFREEAATAACFEYTDRKSISSPKRMAEKPFNLR